MNSEWYISFRMAYNEHGDQIVTVIEGGRHFGGVSMGRLNIGSGGLSTASAEALEEFITAHVLMHFGGIQQRLL